MVFTECGKFEGPGIQVRSGSAPRWGSGRRLASTGFLAHAFVSSPPEAQGRQEHLRPAPCSPQFLVQGHELGWCLNVEQSK